jgi:hypothetical protein
VALHFNFTSAPDIKTTDQKNMPTAVIELVTDKASLGTWAASSWAGEAVEAERVESFYAQSVGARMAHDIAARLIAPQTIAVGGKEFSFALRPLRVYHPFTLTLLKATHTTYPGTDIPKDFRSRVVIDHPQAGEKREVEISMNQPLRYGGYAYYQYQMGAGEMVLRAGQKPYSVLQVVRNPSWLTPYIGCALVGIGLLVQFLYHLIGFITKRKKS